MKKLLGLVSFSIALAACTDEYVGESYEDLGSGKTSSVDKETFGNTIVLGKKLNNP